MSHPLNPEESPSLGEPGERRPQDEESRTRELVSELLPHTAAGIAVLGGDLSLTSWNPLAHRLSGYELEEVASLGLARIFEPEEVMQHILSKAQNDLPTLSEYMHLRCADGRLVPVVVQCSTQHHLQGDECRFVVSFRELAPLQERLRRHEHLQMLGRLASALSHEIRNPLNAIFLHADVLEEELRDPSPEAQAQMEESLAEIKTEIGRLNDLVQDYLSLARLADLPREPADLGELVASCAREMQEPLGGRNITLHLEGLDDLPPVSLHRNAFRRVLLNLIQNAMDAMPEGGTLTIRGQCAASRVRLEVSDTGTGISEEQIPLLFTPFHTTKEEGTGLGLYVVQQIIAAHEGEITVSSEVGSGTTFIMSLPLASAPAEDA
jgi:two-component system, sporulation sensor kinase E